MDLDPIWLGSVLSKHSRDNSVVRVLSFEVENSSGIGENYASSVFCATVKVVLGSGRVTSRKVFVKRKLTNLPVELSGGFVMESITYNNILFEFESMINDNCLEYGKFWPDCLYGSHDILMLENLMANGFKLASRKTGFDLDHAKIVVTNLARMHSLSLVAVAKGTLLPKMLPDFFIIGPGGVFVKTALDGVANAVSRWSPEWSEVEKKIRDLAENILSTLEHLYRQSHKTSVVNHGDCWVNNIMFKYDNQSIPIESKFIDFQICHYNTYAWDLIYFIYTSIPPKYISTHYDSFLETYCQEFSKNLKSLGHDPSTAPTVQEAKDEIIRLHPFVKAIGIGYLPVMRNPSDVHLTLEDLAGLSPKYASLFEDKNVEQLLQDMLKHMISNNIM